MGRVFIIGSGVVGQATGTGLAGAGNAVTFVDVSAERVRALKDAGFDAAPELDLRGAEDSHIFLTLPTPNNGRRYDLTAFEGGVRDVGRAMASSEATHTVVTRSTVPPGTVVGLVAPLLEEASGKREGDGFHVASNPEFLRAASAAEDFRWPWMTVIAARNKRVRERLGGLLESFGGEMRIFEDPATAEMIKCVHNAYNAAKISFWNEIWRLCRHAGIDHDLVAATVARSAEGSFNPQYGINGGRPFGGACLPKDTQGLLGFADSQNVEMPVLTAVVSMNEAMETMLAAFEAGRRDVVASTAHRAAGAPPADPATSSDGVRPKFAGRA